MPDSLPMPKVIVIGAGPAGAVAALVLARAGIDVALIEQHRFPRDKVCGECLSAVGIDVLTRLGLSSLILAHHPAVLKRSVIFISDGRTVELPMRKPMWGISRRAMDTTLLHAARAAGVRVIQPARCEQIEPGSPCRLRVRMLHNNDIDTMEARHVIVADGKAALMPQPPPPSGDLGLKAHFSRIDAPTDAIELFGVAGHYGGAAPIEDELWNIAFSVPAARLKQHGRNLDLLFRDIVSENRGLADQMTQAVRVSEWLTSPLPRFGVKQHWPEGIIPVGNAAAAMEPIGGEGMGLAIRSAELAAAAVLQAIQHDSDVNTPRLARSYRRLWTVRRAACRAGARIISSPTLSKITVPLADIDGLGSLVLKLVGK